MNVPWYALSPSPITIIFYGLLSLYGAKKMMKGSNSKSLFTWIKTANDSLIFLGIIVLIGDVFWCVACYLRFASTFTGGLQLIVCIIRDLAGLTLCVIWSKPLFKSQIVKFDFLTFIGFTLLIVFLTVWFVEAGDPSWTDWTYAIRNNYSLQRILTSVFISHGIGKSITALLYVSSWRI